MPFYCKKCSFCCSNNLSLVKHAFEAHSFEVNFVHPCGIGGCPHSFTTGSTFKTFKSHVYRKHSGGLEELNAEQEAGVQTESDSEDLTGDVIRMDLGDPENCDEGQDLDESTQIQHGSKLNETAARFLLSLKEKYRLTQSAVNFTVAAVDEMMRLKCEQLHRSVEDTLATADGGCIPDISCCFVADSPFKGLETEYLQMKYYKEHFNLVVSVPYLKLA